MRSIIYIGHKYHLRTRSTQFLISLLKTAYEVDEATYDADTQEWTGDTLDSGKQYDVLVLFQMPVLPEDIAKHFTYRHGVYFPMYDGIGEAPDSFWVKYSKFVIINFSRTLHDRLTELGLTSKYIQYFPKPIAPVDWGKPSSAFFWPRTEHLTVNNVLPMLERIGVKDVHLHIAADPLNKTILPNEEHKQRLSFTYSEWFDTKDEMLNTLQRSAIYVAPRTYEGIGMSFLEAMACGRCVAAIDHPTMNEYIRDGENGLLFDDKRYELKKPEDVLSIQKAAYRYIEEGYAAWLRLSPKILDWIMESPKPFAAKRIPRLSLGGLRLVDMDMDGRFYLLGKLRIPNRLISAAKKLRGGLK